MVDNSNETQATRKPQAQVQKEYRQRIANTMRYYNDVLCQADALRLHLAIAAANGCELAQAVQAPDTLTMLKLLTKRIEDQTQADRQYAEMKRKSKKPARASK